jgi:signal transduction histidine kinase/CheY-like chemotaxis protein
MLCVFLDAKLALDQDESELLHTLASDLAFALFNIEARQDLEQARVKVRNYYQELDSQNKKLKILNAELEAKNNELEQANQKANESEELKSHFLANISHEIRTPLNGILGFTQLIKQAKYMPEKMDEYFDIISFSGNQLMQTIDNILDISKLRTGQLEVKSEMCNLIELVEDVYDFNKTIDLNSKHLDFSIETGALSKGKFVYTDQSKLKQILNILVQNAFKFTKKGSVTIGIREFNDQVMFYVQDTGIGISPEKYKIIFDSFRQADQKSTREFGGVGLGLSIAKGLVKILNGEIWLESKLPDHKNAKNGGTTFYFSIPYCTEYNNEKHKKIMDLNKIETLDWSSKIILIVEDDTFSAEYLSEAISVTGAKLYHAQNGNDAVLKAKEMPDLDLILMDIQLPGLSGDKATRAIREFNPEIPIIAQTAHAMINDRENYINAGCTDYISKPIAVNELFSILCKYL